MTCFFFGGGGGGGLKLEVDLLIKTTQGNYKGVSTERACNSHRACMYRGRNAGDY